MYGCSLLTADSELNLLLGYYVARLLDWMKVILDPRFHQLCNASLRNKALLYLTSVFSYNLVFTSGATRPCKIFNFDATSRNARANFVCIVLSSSTFLIFIA